MNAWLADDTATTGDNPWLARATPRARRERRRALNAKHKTHGQGAWKPFVPVTPAMIERAAAHLQTVLHSDARMEGQAHVL